MKKIEVIATFLDKGRIVPRRVRYYDELEAEYIVRDVAKIYFQEKYQHSTRFLISFDISEEDVGLIFDEKETVWYMDI